MRYDENLPSVVISLDFELRWGMYDKLGLDMDAYRENLENVWNVVPSLLEMFRDRNIKATWACVGALGCRDWADYFNRAPKLPKYDNSTLAFNRKFADLDPSGHLHFAPELIEAIYNTPGQELGTHTFSHIYMREPGVTSENVKADLVAVTMFWNERFGVSPVSLVFPRNQCSFMTTVLESGIKIWRGNESSWYYECCEARNNRLLPRTFRLLDSLNPFISRAAYLERNVTRSSLFLRWNLPQTAWKLHLLRIKNELDHLLPGQVFHIWWHPHNLGKDMKLRLSRVEEVTELIADKNRRGLLTSKAMRDLIV